MTIDFNIYKIICEKLNNCFSSYADYIYGYILHISTTINVKRMYFTYINRKLF